MIAFDKDGNNLQVGDKVLINNLSGTISRIKQSALYSHKRLCHVATTTDAILYMYDYELIKDEKLKSETNIPAANLFDYFER